MSGKAGGGQLRVIAGVLRGRRIATLAGEAVRPTGDRVREALFDILGNSLVDGDFLDIYAGTGAIGIEALSRGARTVTFIEQDPAAAGLIRENLSVAGGLSSRGRVIVADPAQAFAILGQEGQRFGFIYLDPPYAGAELERGLLLVGESGIVGDSAVIIAEHEARAIPPACPTLSALRTARYGRAALTFYRLMPRRVDTILRDG